MREEAPGGFAISNADGKARCLLDHLLDHPLQGGGISGLGQGRSQEREERLTLMTFVGRGKNRQTCHESPPGHINHPHKTSYVSPASSLPTCVPSQLTCFLLPSALPLPLLTPILCSITCTRCSKVGASSVSPRSRGCCWGEIPEWGESPLPSLFLQSLHSLSPGLTLSGLAPNVVSSSSAGSSIME